MIKHLDSNTDFHIYSKINFKFMFIHFRISLYPKHCFSSSLICASFQFSSSWNQNWPSPPPFPLLMSLVRLWWFISTNHIKDQILVCMKFSSKLQRLWRRLFSIKYNPSQTPKTRYQDTDTIRSQYLSQHLCSQGRRLTTHILVLFLGWNFLLSSTFVHWILSTSSNEHTGGIYPLYVTLCFVFESPTFHKPIKLLPVQIWRFTRKYTTLWKKNTLKSPCSKLIAYYPVLHFIL